MENMNLNNTDTVFAITWNGDYICNVKPDKHSMGFLLAPTKESAVRICMTLEQALGKGTVKFFQTTRQQITKECEKMMSDIIEKNSGYESLPPKKTEPEFHLPSEGKTIYNMNGIDPEKLI